MDFIFEVPGAIGSTFASFYADHTLSTAGTTIIAILFFWKLMGWQRTPDFSDLGKIAKNGLRVLIGWAIAILILDFIYTIVSKICDMVGGCFGGLIWLRERFIEQPVVVFACLLIALLGFGLWSYLSRKLHIMLKATVSILAFYAFVGVAVPIANHLKEGAESSITPEDSSKLTTVNKANTVGLSTTGKGEGEATL